MVVKELNMRIAVLLSTGLSALSLLNIVPAMAQDDADWRTVETNVRFVSFDRAESKRGSLHLSTINGRYAAEMDIDSYWHWVEESDRPGYQYMVNFGSDFFVRLWYFNSNAIRRLPPVNGMVFVALVKAVSDDGRYQHFRVYRNEASNEMTIIFPDDPVFGKKVFRTGRSDYPYRFSAGAFTWYFSL